VWIVKGIHEQFNIENWRIVGILTGTLLVLVCYGMTVHPVRFGLSVGAMLLVSAWQADMSYVLYRERSFFAVYRVEADNINHYHRLMHGTTMHGKQRLDENPLSMAAFLTPLAATGPIDAAGEVVAAQQAIYERRNEALTYFHRSGPIGQIFEALMSNPK